MTLKTKFFVLGLVLIAIVAATEWLNHEDNVLADKQKTAVELVQRHMDADMKHDGIRGNVFSAMVASKIGDAELLKASQDDVATMSGEFIQDTEDNIAADIPADLKQQFLKIKESVAAYTDYSKKISQEAAGDFDTVVTMLPEFERVFGVLEEDQGKATDMILEWSLELHDSGEKIGNYLRVALIALFIVAILLPVFAARAIFKPLSSMEAAMQRLSGGDTSFNIPSIERKDEIGEMARSVQVFKENALKIESLNKEQEAQKRAVETLKRQTMNEMADSFEMSVGEVVAQVATSASQMRAGAESVTHIAEDTKQRSNVVVQASSEAAQISLQVAAAAEEMTASIKEISAQTQRSSQVAGDAASKAEFAKQSINLLAEKSKRVEQIIEIITSIAGQINLLALNATIESARAGEAGKGFAVVASEVKNLASQVGKATSEITQQISEMQGATKTSVDSVMDILGIIDQVSAGTSAVAAAVEEQSAVTNEIAQNVARTSAGTQQISHNMTSVQEGAEKTEATAWEVLESAKNLGKQSETLKQRVDDFLRTIRAA